MPNIFANNIYIEYDTFGSPEADPIILICGLGIQMVYWDEVFCRLLAEKGHYVIRFDNRDIGLSEKFDHQGVPDVPNVLARLAIGEVVDLPYTLVDMANDTVGLIDALGIEKAHFCGLSMGGAIAQTVAVHHPNHILTLVSMMCGTGDAGAPQPNPEIREALSTPSPCTRKEYLDHNARYWRIVGSPVFDYDEAWVRKRAADSFDRSHYPFGKFRQMLAIRAAGNRKPDLAKIVCPTLVIHGSEDPLVPVEAGEDTAKAIPTAEWVVIPGMGHDLPPNTWPEIVELITNHTHGMVK